MCIRDSTEYFNKNIDELISKYTISTDLKAREDASRRIQQTAVDEAAWVYLYQPDLVLATRKNVKGVSFYPADVRFRYYHMYKE